MSSNDEGPSKKNKDSKYEKKPVMISSPREDKKKTKEVQIGSKKKNRYVCLVFHSCLPINSNA